MTGRLPSLLVPPIAFAHRGASANAPANTIDSFVAALRLGATGLHTDARLTADGHVALLADASVGPRLRRRLVSETNRDDLPAGTATLGDLYLACGTSMDVALDVADPSAASVAVEVARNLGADGHLWLCHGDLDTLAAWRVLDLRVRLVHATHRDRLPYGPERHASELARLEVDAVRLHHSQWSGGNVALYHRFGRLALGEDAEFLRLVAALLDAGIDGVSSNHAELLATGLSAFGMQ